MESKSWTRYGIYAVFLCLLVAGVYAVGITWGRYRTDITAGLVFQARQPEPFRLWGETDSASGLAGNWQELSGNWIHTDSGAELAFCVSNGMNSTEYAGQSQSFCIRLIGTLGIADPSRFQVTLTTNDSSDDPVSYTANCVPISEDSPLFRDFGPGWLYRFYDTDNREVRWELPGAQLSMINALLRVEGEAETSLLELQVITDGA